MTANDIIASAKIDFPDVSDVTALAVLQEIHNEICFGVPLYRVSQDISLTAGQNTYALPAGLSRLYDVRYMKSATSSEQLLATSRDQLDQEWGDHVLESGVPTHFYTDLENIVFVPNPTTTTSGGYPKVVINYTTTPTLTGGSVFPTLPTYQAWIDGLKMRFALRSEDKRYSVYEREYQKSLHRLVRSVQSLAHDYVPKMLPPGALQSFRVRR